MNFVDGSGKVLNTIHANNFKFFEEISLFVQEEPNSAMDMETLKAVPLRSVSMRG